MIGSKRLSKMYMNHHNTLMCGEDNMIESIVEGAGIRDGKYCFLNPYDEPVQGYKTSKK